MNQNPMPPDLLKLIEAIEQAVREAVALSPTPPSEDILKKNLRLLNVVMAGADKDFINLLPEVNKPEAKQLFDKAREVFSLYIEVFNQYKVDRIHGYEEEKALEMAKQTLQEEQQPLSLA